MKFARGLVLLLALTAGACAPAASQITEELETVPPTEVLTPTPTIVWFPPSATPTPLPTQVIFPTPEQRPGVGAVLLEDDFSSQEDWQTFKTDLGSISYGRSELTVAIHKSKTILTSLRDGPVLDDFYLELTTHASLCRGSDSYGLVLRAAGAGDHYRFALNCQGQIRLERVKGSKMIPIQDWMTSGQVPPGSPLIVRVGVWAVRDELRFFINDIYQFGVRDPVFRAGTVGVFARSGGETVLSASFSDLKVRSIDASQIPTPQPPTATSRPGKKTPTPTPRPTGN